MKQKATLMEGPIWKGIIYFTLPILLGQIFQQLYSTADAWVVGHYLSDNEYAAVTSTSSLAFLLVGFFGGIAVGAGVVIARYFGARDLENLKTSVYTTVILGLFAGLLMTAIGVFFTPVMLEWMDTPDKILPYSIEYFRYYFLGALGTVMYNLTMGILRAVGDSRHPLYYLIFSSVVNIVLDFLFIGGFGWGVWSAALATSISQFVSAGLCLLQLMRTKAEYRFCPSDRAFRWSMLREIVRYGLPSGVQNSITAMANVVVQKNINFFGPDAVAGCGTFAKLEGFTFLPITCFVMALTTFVSQNLGAKQYDRTKRGVKMSIIACVILAEVVGAIMILLREPLMRFFTSNDAAVEVGMRQTLVEAPFFCMLALTHCFAAILRGAGKPMIPMFILIGVWCGLRVTYLTVLVPIVNEVWIVFSAFPVTWTVSSILFAIFYFKTDWLHGFEKKKLKKA